MSLFSRLFRKTPPLSPAPSPGPAPALNEKASKALAEQNQANRALAAAAEAQALQAAIDAQDVPAVARLVVAGTSTKVRQAAAQAIDDADVLRQLIREVRGGNDSNVYKILTAKRDAQAGQARQLEQLQAEIKAAAEALDRHSQAPYDSSYSPLLIQFETRWEAVATQADAELSGRVQQCIARSHETIAAHQRQLEAEASRVQAAASAAAEARRLREEQAQAAAAVAAEQAQIAEAQQHALAEKQNTEQQALRQMAELIRKARGALGGGDTARAATMRRTIEAQRADAPPLPTSLANQLQQLDQQLAQLKDWKQFSVTPKRAELIEEMALLVDVTLDPLALAERIKSLQAEWRALNKGAGEQLDADSQRFQEVTQKAYAPCREYFAAQALIKQQNLKQRDGLIAQLTAFEAAQHGEHPDWRLIINTLREMKQAWRGHSPVDPNAAKPQQEKFSALIASLQGRLDAEYARNVQQKQSLIERAQALLGSDDGRKTIDTVKVLQQQWQALGPVPREVDQGLWATFRQHCDAVFQKRDQDFAAQTAALEGNKAQAIALCEQLEQIAALDGTELLARVGTLGELRTAFEALGEFPRADTLVLRKRFDQGVERCKTSQARQKVRDAEQAWGNLFDAAQHINAYQLAAANQVDVAALAALKATAESGIAAVSQWPKGGLDALQQALTAKPATDLAANETAARMLCIRAEILTDLPTPPEDQALRREYQLQRLVQRLKADETSLNALAMEWVGLGPVDGGVYESLQQRFRRCRERAQAIS